MNLNVENNDTAQESVTPLSSIMRGDGEDAAGDPMGLGAQPGGTNKRTLPTGALLLALTIVVAGGSLYVMRQMGLGAKLSFAEIKIDYPIDTRGITPLDERFERLLSNLKGSGTIVQVPLSQLQKNPFELAGSTPQEVATLIDPEAERARREREAREARQRAIDAAFVRLRLNSIVGGAVPIARISGRPVRIGDTVADLFTVKAIHGRSVDLEADGKIYTLRIGQP